jgi:hypothetical protein
MLAFPHSCLNLFLFKGGVPEGTILCVVLDVTNQSFIANHWICFELFLHRK